MSACAPAVEAAHARFSAACRRNRYRRPPFAPFASSAHCVPSCLALLLLMSVSLVSGCARRSPIRAPYRLARQMQDICKTFFVGFRARARHSPASGAKPHLAERRASPHHHATTPPAPRRSRRQTMPSAPPARACRSPPRMHSAPPPPAYQDTSPHTLPNR